MNLKLSCADFTFPLLSHEHALDLIAMLGFKGVDIGLFHQRSHLEPTVELKRVATSAARLAKKLGDRGLKPADIFLIPGTSFEEFSPNHPDKAIRRAAREQFQRGIEYTLRAGGHHFGALPGVFHAGEPKSESLKVSVEELSWRVAYAKKHKVIYSVEPHIGSVAPNPKAAEKLVKLVPGLTLTLDYTHFTYAGRADNEVEPLIKYASHFHCRGGRRGRVQASFDKNTIDYARILKVMKKTGYSGFVGIEYVWQDWQHCNECDNVSETIRFRDFLRSVKL